MIINANYTKVLKTYFSREHPVILGGFQNQANELLVNKLNELNKHIFYF